MKDAIRQFLKLESAGGILLIIASILAMVFANTAFQGLYHGFLNTPVTVGVGALVIDKPLILWINDGLMAVFFLVIGLEVKRELLEGSLATKEQAIFPAVAAVGGMVIPALVFLMFNFGDDIARDGWAIPAATDIAFALGIMALLGSRVPISLKIFLLALAIIDDLGAIVIIALFYSSDLSVMALVIAFAATALLFWMNIKDVTKISWYVVVGIILWVSVLKSGVHATLAGVVIGFAIPLKGDSKKDKEYSPLKTMEHALHPYVAYFILPIFAFANAGVSLQGVSMGGLTSMLPLGIIFGLLFGKPIGITLASWLAVKSGMAKLPEGVTFIHIVAVSVLCGIGFTMSMFISSLAFEQASADFGTYSRLGILIGSLLAAVIGYFLLHKTLPKEPAKVA
ncbi:Na+/H+ antiporter NhaA [Vibrio sp. SS-MA-C1-2]|uniref:Na+/H+ antiporter NhaA n=1 Tax=Vibrio sp. SS-MA-C1-2 TaxID=2908646 RepID=UPI001F217303|nr:Na+/H+ antiporter NhaA [Vibrio sp. SS-MA-C1-2]UJF19682.1 Na+/H+ antiporter NhaA [Vibrio sp. SS-MA-C1-2]